MSDRLQELLRQRALLQEHLAWLDREIEAASGRAADQPTPLRLAPRPAFPPAPASQPPPSPSGYLASQAAAITRHAAETRAATAAAATDENPRVAATADAILEEYRVPPDALKTDLRKGCILYFIAALGLLAAGVTVLYFLISKR
ncbi:MAG: hypothetical protein NTV51_24130 [Verrucomicrobia bacterium]|nr:hypothetical protein [Verrucomicrobiota bacterium]